MNWEIIGKISVALVLFCSVIGIIYLITAFASWKGYVDRRIESLTKVNEELFQHLKNIEVTVKEAISVERREDVKETN